uniref:Uncharacterized protein n=1 Tax=Fomitiporia mediterranea TaxID=208960 RepID=A0A5B9RKC0_9AGAM|nr:hypothetical protein Fomme_000107 [Fomitiporia mediterranea]QEG57117.1 hypothetical protein Fomme_000107 [Fomitiporia mediterranea]
MNKCSPLLDHLTSILNKDLKTKTLVVSTLSNLTKTNKFQTKFEILVFKVHKVFLTNLKEEVIGPKLTLSLKFLVNKLVLLKNVLKNPILLLSFLSGMLLFLLFVFFDFIWF